MSTHLFKPGQSGNPAGRPKGAVSRTTQQFKEMMADFLAGNFERVQEELNKQSGHRYIDSFVKLAKFVPDFLSNDVKVDASGEVRISVEYVPSVVKVENIQDVEAIEQPLVHQLPAVTEVETVETTEEMNLPF